MLALNSCLKKHEHNRLKELLVTASKRELGWGVARPLPAVQALTPAYRWALLAHGLPEACATCTSTLTVAWPRSFLQSLTTLSLTAMEVDLPALASITHRLQKLKLQRCRLYSRCAPGEGAHFSAPQLRLLDLAGASIDACISAAYMPSLDALCLERFSSKGDVEHILLHESVRLLLLAVSTAPLWSALPSSSLGPSLLSCSCSWCSACGKGLRCRWTVAVCQT
jgi:hypothetical protein